MKNIKLYVEGIIDKIIVSNILKAANFPSEKIIIEVAEGKRNVIQFAKNNSRNLEEITAVLLDADTHHIPDALAQIRQHFEDNSIKVFCVIPSIEAWLFADDVLIQKIAPEQHKKNIARLPQPEEITFPKEVFHRWIKSNKFTDLSAQYDFLKEMHIFRAAARSASLHYFLKEMANMLEIEIDLRNRLDNVYEFPNQIIATLLKEVANEDTIMFRTLAGYNITAKELQKSVAENTQEGKEYASNLLKVARDIIRSQANRHKTIQ